MLSGRVFTARIVSEETDYLEVEDRSRKKPKIFRLDKDLIFSVIDEKGDERVYYAPEENDIFSVDEMRYYVYGAQDAHRYYKKNAPALIAATAGIAFGYALASEKSFFIVVTPVAATICGTLFVGHRPKPKFSRSDEMLRRDAYIKGFKRTAKSKKLFNAIRGALVGSIVGISIGYLSNPD